MFSCACMVSIYCSSQCVLEVSLHSPCMLATLLATVWQNLAWCGTNTFFYSAFYCGWAEADKARHGRAAIS
jgi:hypothetical protein